MSLLPSADPSMHSSIASGCSIAPVESQDLFCALDGYWVPTLPIYGLRALCIVPTFPSVSNATAPRRNLQAGLPATDWRIHPGHRGGGVVVVVCMDVGVGFKVSTGVCGFMAATTSHLIVHSSFLRPVLPYGGLDGTPAVLRPCTASVPPWMMPDAHVHHQWPWPRLASPRSRRSLQLVLGWTSKPEPC